MDATGMEIINREMICSEMFNGSRPMVEFLKPKTYPVCPRVNRELAFAPLLSPVNGIRISRYFDPSEKENLAGKSRTRA